MVKKDNANAPMSLEDWLNTRSSWLRMAADILIKSRRLPTEDEMDELTTHCLGEAAKTLETTYPPLAPGVILGTTGAGALRIDSLSAIRGVNAIGVDATLELSNGNLSVVYGANGSGKSGYTRLIKHICGARAKGTIHSNVFDDAAEGTSARVRITTVSSNDGSPVSTDLHWVANAGPHPKLTGVPVFDSATALELGDTPSTATHLPRAMRFVGLLIGISDRINDRLKARAAKLVSRLPIVPSEHAQTPAAVYLQKLKPSLTVDEVATSCAFSEALLQERLALETALAQLNPAVAHAKSVGDIERLANLGENVSGLIEYLSNERASALVLARKNSIQKREAATMYATSFINGLPLKGVGDSIWQTLWTAAKRYSLSSAYPDHAHPYVGEDARCVLCQQTLEADGKARLASFEQYLNDTLQIEAKTAEETLASLSKDLPTFLESTWQTQCSAVGLDSEQTGLLANEIYARIKAMSCATEMAEVPAVTWSIWSNALNHAVATTTAKRDALAALLDPAGRAQKETRLRELRAQEWLAGQIDAVKAEVIRLKRLATIDVAIHLTQTRALTTKSNEIGESELAKGFCERFNTELEALGGRAVPVQMNHRALGKGVYSFNLELRDAARAVKNREVLSEGEQRIVAMAAFLADATGTDRRLPVIFDDPISSLDQRYEEAVAKRLVDLAEHCQVIVFTHRLSLLVLLGNAAKQRSTLGLPSVNVHVSSIGRDGDSTGVPSTIDVFSLKPKAGYNQMVSGIGALKKYDLPLKKLALKDACSNFRILVERSVEDHLCCGVINRYRREINTLGKLNGLHAITPRDCAMINGMMSKYSAFEHSQSTETPTWLPDPDELLADVQAMLEWINDFDKRAKEAAAN